MENNQTNQEMELIEKIMEKPEEPLLMDEEWMNRESMDPKQLREGIKEWAKNPKHRNAKIYKPCEMWDCFFHRTVNDTHESGGCCYTSYMIDHPEHRPAGGKCMRGCLPGKGCIRYMVRECKRPRPKTVRPVPKTRTKEEKKPKKEGHTFRFDCDRVLELYRKGMSDVRIAKEIGCSPKTVMAFRHERGLEANMYQVPEDRRLDEDKVMFLYKNGYSDGEIARRVQSNTTRIARWRNANGLPAHENPIRTGREKKIDREQVHRLYEKGLTDKQIAAALDCGKTTVERIRRENRWLRNTEQRTTAEEHSEEIMELYLRGWTDIMIGEEIGISTSAIWKWRKRHGLKSTQKNANDKTLCELHAQGLTDLEISKKLSVSVYTAQKMRIRNGLKANRGPVWEETHRERSKKRMETKNRLEEERKILLEMNEQGKSKTEMEQATGRSRSHINKLLAGAENVHKKNETEMERERVRLLHEQGMSILEIMKETGRGDRWISKTLKEMGYQMKRGRRPKCAK